MKEEAWKTKPKNLDEHWVAYFCSPVFKSRKSKANKDIKITKKSRYFTYITVSRENCFRGFGVKKSSTPDLHLNCNLSSDNMPKIHPAAKAWIIKRLKTRSIAEVAGTSNVSQRQVQRIKKRFEETGDVFDKPRSVRPHKTTAQKEHMLISVVQSSSQESQKLTKTSKSLAPSVDRTTKPTIQANAGKLPPTSVPVKHVKG
ncbi:unnamed protein product [Ranitomeya imitator]|uniref:Transposase n=1 Tax=Ranitomeya imitator TaxID=111125 RepID=A0ABN9LCV5_9NEOB|nr:unnamed protein product [Ranitomeya imitator]